MVKLGAEEYSFKAQMSALGIPQIAVVHGISVAGAFKTFGPVKY